VSEVPPPWSLADWTVFAILAALVAAALARLAFLAFAKEPS
jgi:hypothetical protein